MKMVTRGKSGSRGKILQMYSWECPDPDLYVFVLHISTAYIKLKQ